MSIKYRRCTETTLVLYAVRMYIWQQFSKRVCLPIRISLEKEWRSPSVRVVHGCPFLSHQLAGNVETTSLDREAQLFDVHSARICALTSGIHTSILNIHTVCPPSYQILNTRQPCKFDIAPRPRTSAVTRRDRHLP